MNSLLEEIYATKIVKTANGEPRDAFPAFLTREDGEILYDLARNAPEGDALEVGMAYGGSSLFIAQALRDRGQGRLISIDPYQTSYWEKIGYLNLERAGLDDLVTLIEERSFKVVPRLEAEKANISMAFLDGNHRFEHIFVEFFYLDRILKEGASLVFHDLWMQSTRKLFSFILRNHGDCYQLESKYLPAQHNKLKAATEFVKLFRSNPVDLAVAKELPRVQFNNVLALRKIRHRTDDEYDENWLTYRSF